MGWNTLLMLTVKQAFNGAHALLRVPFGRFDEEPNCLKTAAGHEGILKENKDKSSNPVT